MGGGGRCGREGSEIGVRVRGIWCDVNMLSFEMF